MGPGIKTMCLNDSRPLSLHRLPTPFSASFSASGKLSTRFPLGSGRASRFKNPLRRSCMGRKGGKRGGREKGKTTGLDSRNRVPSSLFFPVLFVFLSGIAREIGFEVERI